MKPFIDWPELMTPEDLKQCLDYPHVAAYSLFNRPDFPLIDKVKRGKRIGKYALQAYLNRGVPIHTA